MPFLLRVELPDVPGSLGRLASAIGESGGDIEAIEIVEKRHDGTAVDDVLLEMHGGSMPDSIVSACNALEGVTVLWINRYAAGGNLFLDLEAVEELTADPEKALDRVVDLLPDVFRADWAARVHRLHGVGQRTNGAPDAARLRRPRDGVAGRGRRRRRQPLRGGPHRRQRDHRASAAAAGPSSSTPSWPGSATWSRWRRSLTRP